MTPLLWLATHPRHVLLALAVWTVVSAGVALAAGHFLRVAGEVRR